MKSTSIIREIDSYGRLVIPIEMRRVLCGDDNKKIKVEIYTLDDKIVINRVEPHCVFCDVTENLVDYRQKRICKNCLAELNK